MKSLYLGAPLSFFIAGVQVSSISVPIVGFEITDVPQDPFYGYHPLVERAQLELVSRAFSFPRFCICFVNEAVIPVFEVWAAPDQDNTKEMLAILSEILAGLPENIPEAVQENALDVVQSSLVAVQEKILPTIFLQRIPLQIASKAIYTHTSPATGEWRFDLKDEGGNLEQTIQELVESRFPGQVFRGPMVDDGVEKRELTDVMLVTVEAVFLFESKVLAVLERGRGISVERRAKSVAKHFAKAIGQLVGGVKRLRSGAKIYSSDGNLINLTIGGKDIHAVNVVTTELAKLDFKKVAGDLTAAASEAMACYHFIDLAQLQQHVVFAKSSHHLNEYFRRRFEVVNKSGNASIQTRFAKYPEIPMRTAPIPDNGAGCVFCFESSMVPNDEKAGELYAVIFDFLKADAFSGRLELYHRLAQTDATRHELAIGVFFVSNSRIFEDAKRWAKLSAKFAAIADVESGLAFIENRSRNAPLDKVRRHFESVVSVEFVKGVQVAFE